jgi:hypothetical protein
LTTDPTTCRMKAPAALMVRIGRFQSRRARLQGSAALALSGPRSPAAPSHYALRGYFRGWNRASNRSNRNWAGPTSRSARTEPSVGIGNWSVVPSPSAGGPTCGTRPLPSSTPCSTSRRPPPAGVGAGKNRRLRLRAPAPALLAGGRSSGAQLAGPLDHALALPARLVHRTAAPAPPRPA